MKSSAQIQLFSRISSLDILFFTKHLATMIKAGIPITEAFEILIDQTKSTEFKKILKKMSDQIKNGQNLNYALSKYPKKFNKFYSSMIQIGEESGTLDTTLEFLSKQLSKSYSLRKKIKGALLYPTVILIATLVMSALISFFVLPQLVDFFEAFDVELPLATKILLAISMFMKNYNIIFFSSIVVFLALFKIVVNSKIVKPTWHIALLKIPIFGKLIAYGQVSQFARNLGVLLKSGVPASRSIEITANTLSNEYYKRALHSMQKALNKGNSIGKTLSKKRYRHFPMLVAKMINVGEKTGKLDEILMYLSNFYETEIDSTSKNLTTTLEPFLLIVIGLAVGCVALAIITPIYQLTGSIR